MCEVILLAFMGWCCGVYRCDGLDMVFLCPRFCLDVYIEG